MLGFFIFLFFLQINLSDTYALPFQNLGMSDGTAERYI